ncbi:chemotaxis protein CheW [Desulfoferrobacter suflitae]|uniref:chemotaxis protein CheW n=1 Tax=Desulfoferrobacter suflitae TaxID=2865782 RepID=UPI00216409B2|nr:chemotaxis protein CheW [Desulfoferrobacter suflitae]MCK8601653.1 chemotaxis protein CheW [Desulfoferrobacter suflitae]
MLLLIFFVGKERYGIDSRKVVEVVPVVNCKPVPHAPSHVAGLLSYRGDIVPVVDLSALIGGAPARHLLSTRVILVKYVGADANEHILGLLAERVTETLKCREEDFKSPGFVASAGRYLGDLYIDGEGMIQRIVVEAVLPEELRRSLFAEAEKVADALSAS